MTKPINTDGIAKKLKTAAIVPAAIIFVCVVIAVVVLGIPTFIGYVIKDDPISVAEYKIVLQHFDGNESYEFKTLFREHFSDEIITNDEFSELMSIGRQDDQARNRLKFEEMMASLRKLKESPLGVEDTEHKL